MHKRHKTEAQQTYVYRGIIEIRQKHKIASKNVEHSRMPYINRSPHIHQYLKICNIPSDEEKSGLTLSKATNHPTILGGGGGL